MLGLNSKINFENGHISTSNPKREELVPSTTPMEEEQVPNVPTVKKTWRNDDSLIHMKDLAASQLGFDIYDDDSRYTLKDLKKFLNDYSAEEDEWNFRQGKTYWNVPRNAYLPFLILFSRCANQNEGFSDPFYENPTNESPISIILNFKFRTHFEDPVKIYTSEVLNDIMRVVTNTIRHSTCSFSPSEKDFHSIISFGTPEKDSNGITTFPLKIVYPNFRINSTFIERAILQELNDDLLSDDVAGIFPLQLQNGDQDNFVCYSIYQTGIPMDDGRNYYMAYALSCPIVSDDEIVFMESIEELFDVSDHKLALEIDFKRLTETRHSNENPLLWVPLVLSQEFTMTTKTVPPGSYHIQSNFNCDTFGEIDVSASNLRDTKISLINDMFRMWNPRRVADETDWRTMGEIICTVYEGKLAGSYIWSQLTRKMISRSINVIPMFMKGGIRDSCLREYIKFRVNRKTPITAMWVAREDNPEKFSKWHWDWCRPAFEKAIISGLHADVAVAIYRAMILDFVCINNRKSTVWFSIRSGRFEEISDAFLSKEITTTMNGYLYRIFTMLLRQFRNDDTTSEERRNQLLDGIRDLIANLKTNHYKRNVICESKGLFENNHIVKFMNKDHEILGVTNGVLIATMNGISFRASRPEDYVSKCAGTGYYEDMFDENHEMIKFIRNWDKKNLHDEDLNQFFRDWKSSILRGKNPEKKILIGTGVGNNSKTTVLQVIDATLGDYSVSMSTSAFTSISKDPNSPSPAWAQTDGVRLISSEEFDQNFMLKTAIINLITGNGSINARLLNENGGNIKILFKVFFAMNYVPSFCDPSPAVRNRVVIIPFNTIYKVGAPVDPEEQERTRTYEVDQQFEDKMDDMKAAYLWDMVDNYKGYLKRKLRECPKASIRATDEYWERADPIYRFIKSSYTPHQRNKEDKSCMVTFDELYGSYKIWYKCEMPEARIPSSDITFRSVKFHWGEPDVEGNNRAWYGVKMANMKNAKSYTDTGMMMDNVTTGGKGKSHFKKPIIAEDFRDLMKNVSNGIETDSDEEEELEDDDYTCSSSSRDTATSSLEESMSPVVDRKTKTSRHNRASEQLRKVDRIVV